jgi:hypothetical protein
MSSKNPEPIVVEELRPITYRGEPVITTKLLARVYGTSEDNIRKNSSRNEERFIEGEHRFTVRGQDLAELRQALRKAQNCTDAEPGFFVTLSHSHIDPKAPSATLWTMAGAIRHSKLLGTDEAWLVYKKLEDAYFTLQDGASARQPRRFDPSSGDLSSTPVMAYSKRFWEEAERLGLKDPQEIAKALNWNRSKVWHFLNMNTQVKKAQDFHVLIGRGFDLRYLIYGERTFSRTELDLIGAYRAGDTNTVQQIAAHRPLKTLMDET